MSHGDFLSDRKRLKQSLSSWRMLAIIAMFLALAILAQRFFGSPQGPIAGGDYIAQITIADIMFDDPDRTALLEEIRDDKHAKALMVLLDSPGGTTFAGEETYLQLRAMAKEKPVVGVMRTLCASACYMAALGTDHVIARESTLTGSIGVLMQSVEVSALVKKLGIAPITVKSGKFKDSPSLTEPFPDDERAVIAQLIDDSYDQFVEKLADRRAMSDAQARLLADGRAYSGRQALKLKLIDQLGGTDDALTWLERTKKIDADLEVRVMDEAPQFESLIDQFTQWTRIELFGRTTVGLDGLVSIWQHSAL